MEIRSFKEKRILKGALLNIQMFSLILYFYCS